MIKPLAQLLRPKSIEGIIGQDHIIGKDKPLYAILSDDFLKSSLLFCGPPGCGKTTLAFIIKNRFKKQKFYSLNAVMSNIKELRDILTEGKKLNFDSYPPILFIDEIHRFNAKQQDALLPYIEYGDIVLIATTTISPYQAVTRPLLSRMNIFYFKALKSKYIVELLKKGIEKYANDLKFSYEFLKRIADKADGDARLALNFLEIAISRKRVNPQLDDDKIFGDFVTVKNNSFKSNHYDYISALIKAMRGSDVDAAIYYLAAMLKLGEDPRFIARRLIIFASEDIGNADPNAIVIANAVMYAVERVGLPEAKINLSHGVIYLSCAPKSNACYKAIKMVERDIDENGIMDVPSHLKNIGNGAKDYLYPHNFKGNVVKQKYLLKKKIYYMPTENGKEREIKERLKIIRKILS